MLVENLYHLLIDLFPSGILDRHPDQSAELTHTMIDMHHEVTDLKLLNLLQREGHLSTAGLITLEVILMETVEYLVVCEYADAQVIIGKTLMEGLFYRGKRYFSFFGKNIF